MDEVDIDTLIDIYIETRNRDVIALIKDVIDSVELPPIAS